MIRVFESFDHLAMTDDGTESNRTSYLWNLGWRFGTYQYNDPIITSGETNPLIQDGIGRFGSRGLRVLDGHIYMPAVARKCDKLIAGACVTQGTGWASFDCMNVDFRFLYKMHQNFRVRVALYPAGYIRVSCFTGLDNGTTVKEYPTIYTPIQIPAPYCYTEFTFIEVFLDVADFMNGRVKVAINNRTYVDVSGIATAAYSVFGSNPFDDRAKLDRVAVVSAAGWAGYYPPAMNYIFDTFYLCDDAGGYQNDFLGDVYMKTCYPTGDGVRSDWMPVENGAVKNAPGAHHEFVDDSLAVPGVEATYLEADQDLSAEMMTFDPDPIPPTSTLIAVNSRTMARNVATPGVPKFNSITPLFQIQGNPVLETNSLTLRSLNWDYFFLDVYYNLVPGFATPWAEYLLEQSQFGFLLRTLENAQLAPEGIIWGDLIDTQHDWDEIIAETLGTLDDLTESVWDVTIEEGLGMTEEPDYGDFLIGETLGLGEAFFARIDGLTDICTGGTATASTSDPGAPPAGAFDHDPGTFWQSTWLNPLFPQWLQYQRANNPRSPLKYRLTIGTNRYNPSGWTFQAAQEGLGWVTLAQVTGFAAAANPTTYTFPVTLWNPNEKYIKFRLCMNAGSFPYLVSIAEMQILVPWTEDFS